MVLLTLPLEGKQCGQGSVSLGFLKLSVHAYYYILILFKGRREIMFKSKSGEVCDFLNSVGNSFLSHWLT